MNTEFKVRINPMTISSISEFYRFRGACIKNEKSVLFLRQLGVYDRLADDIYDMDSFFRNSDNKNTYYLRLSSFSDISSEDIKYYSESFTDFKACNSGKIQIRTNISSGFYTVILNAYKKVLAEYEKYGKVISETIERNIYVKLFFYFDFVMSQIKTDWNEKSVFKIVAENISGIHDYLFLYMLVLIGFDVLLIQHEADIEQKLDLSGLSVAYSMGDFGNHSIKAFSEVKQLNKNKSVKIAEPEIKQTAESEIKQMPAFESKMPSAAPTEKTDKSIEELAGLASSVVLIGIHDSDGNIVGSGSGIMISEKGFILTNYHVVKNGAFFTVKIEDDEQLYPTDEIIKYNPSDDLAVIRIDRRLSPIPIYKGDKLSRGQKVVAIGSPLGLFNTVSDGIISGFRTLDMTEMLQFTAPISRGSSGGALLNMRGEVIGINTAGFDDGQNINLAVSYKCINPFVRGFV